MTEDWRFEHSPHVEEGGLRAYAGVPLRFATEFGDHVSFGSLCVASNSPKASLDKLQQQALARLADWIVDDIIQSARLRRQKERRQMLELLAEAEKQCSKGVKMEEYIPEMLRTKYPTASVRICKSAAGEILLEGGTVVKTDELQSGLWEDTDYFEQVIQDSNHRDMVAPRIVRVIAVQCASQRMPTFLVVGSQDFRDVFDDIDSWFVMMCASLLCRDWQSRALREALDAKETFLRGITHQLRTPIHGILGSVELLTEEMKSRNVVLSHSASASPFASPGSSFDILDPDGYIRTIRTSAKELMTTVNSLIKLNRWTDIAQGERTVAFHNIVDMETALLDDPSPALSEDVSCKPSVVFYRNLPPSLDMLCIDLHLFIDCIQPLVVNAIRHTPNGIVAIALSYLTDYNRLVVDVHDNGRGIAQHDHERIFAAYDKVDIQTTGAGLGLTLACKSAELMNGTISLVSSELGQGSHFRAVFDEITCASSLRPQQLLKQKLVHLPPSFHEVAPPSTFSSLRHCFANFLGMHGYTASEGIEDSFILLDYAQDDLGQVYQHIQRLSKSQIAICLVPESATSSINFQQSRVQREDNVIYVQAPLLITTLEEALEVADAAIAGLKSLTPSLDSQKSDLGGETQNGETENGEVPSTSEEEVAPNPPLVDSRPDPQHRASIFLPSMQTEMAESMQRLDIGVRAPNMPSVGTQKQKSKPMTLLVDDNAVNLRILEIYCTRRSIPYKCAKDGEEAVSTFSDHRAAYMPTFDPLLRQELTTPLRNPFDLILMDLQMPICDGIAATRRIRDLERENGWARSIIIIVTGQDSPGDRADADKAGADGYLVKPVGPKVMDRWMNQWFPSADVG